MYENTRIAKLLKPLGKPVGRIGPLVFRNVHGKQIISGVPGDYRIPADAHSIDKMEGFGAAGIIARQINLHPILKNIWSDHLSMHRTSYSSIYNEITRALYRAQKCSRHKLEGMPRGESETDSRQEAGSFFENMRLVPGSRYISNARVFMLNGEVYIKPAGDEIWDAAAGIITGWQPRVNAGTLSVKGKCKIRSKELWRKQKVRDRLWDIHLSKKAIERAVTWLEDFAGKQFLGLIIPSLCQLTGDYRKDAADAGQWAIDTSLGRCGGKRYFENLMDDLKEFLQLDYLPCRETLDELTAELGLEESRLIEEDMRLSAEYKKVMEAMPKYMYKRIAAAPVSLQRLANGWFKIVRDETTEDLIERFEKISIHIVMYLQDEEGYAVEWTDTIFLTIETDDFYRFKLLLALTKLGQKFKRIQSVITAHPFQPFIKEGFVFRR